MARQFAGSSWLLAGAAMTVFRTVEVALAFVAQNFQAKGKLYSSSKVYLGPAHIIP
jgi:hypothetical protein